MSSAKRPKVGEVRVGPNPENPREISWFEVLGVGSSEVTVCSPHSFSGFRRRPRLRDIVTKTVSLDFFMANFRVYRDHRGILRRQAGNSWTRRTARRNAILKRVFGASR